MSKAMPTPLHRTPVPHCPRAGGFTLIELMISITIGLGILAGLVGVLATSSGNAKTNDRTAELMTNGRYALNSIKQELREAGFRGYTWDVPGAPNPWVAPSTGTRCSEAGSSAEAFITNLRQGIWGSNDANPFPGATNCIPAATYAGDDVMVVRRLGVVPTTTLAANTIYFHSTYERGQLFRSTSSPVPPDFSSSFPRGSFPLQTYVYYISPSTDIATPETPPIPALRRKSLNASGTMDDELVVSGIEHMQVQYGFNTIDPVTRVANVQYQNTLTGTSSAGSTQWEDVSSVRIWLLARNSVAEPGYANTATYPMGDQSYVVNDSFRRQMFSTVVQLRN